VSSDDLHAYARDRGVSRPLYALARAVLAPLLHLWLRLRVTGREHVPPDGPAIIAPNHKSFVDAFCVGLATRRHVRFMAKIEVFGGPLGALLVRLGAFPVRRGESDGDAVATARAILAQGGLLVLFPEGTRVDEPDALGAPHHGAGRLAVEAGAPIVPTAISGTSKLWLGPIPKPRRILVAFLDPVDPAALRASPDAARALIDEQVWPAVHDEYERLRATPGVIAAALAAAGIGGGLLARRRARRLSAPVRILGVVEPRRLRRRRRRR